MTDGRKCKACGAPLTKRKNESVTKYKARVTCGRACPKQRVTFPDPSRPAKGRPRKGKRVEDLPPLLAEIAADFPELAEAIHEVVTRPWNPREAGRWY